MNSNYIFNEPIGIIGSGSFGTALANIAAEKHKVLLYIRTQKKYLELNSSRISCEQKLNQNIYLSTDIKKIIETTKVLFIAVPANLFPIYINIIQPYLTEDHTIIHGTKGLNVTVDLNTVSFVTKDQIKTMSQLMLEKNITNKIGCISGPNLVSELKLKEPTGSIIASKDPIVLKIGSIALEKTNFLINHTNDLVGTELCGVLKNIMAILIGCIDGFKFGMNTKAMFFTKALEEIRLIGELFSIDSYTLNSLAGIGDLIATCFSSDSRNHYFGYQIARGFNYEQIKLSSKKTFEGVEAIKIFYFLAKNYKISLPITNTLYEVIYKQAPASKILEL